MFELIGVAFLKESKEAAGYPMSPDLIPAKKEPSVVRKLGAAPGGSGHDCFLKGICVQMDIIGTAYQWQQIQRYHFFDIVSSQSKMHCITKFDIAAQCTENVEPSTIILANLLSEKFEAGEISREYLLDNLPMGFLLRARCIASYLQLKSMYRQRKNHRLVFWKDSFVKFCEELPEFMELIGEDAHKCKPVPDVAQ